MCCPPCWLRMLHIAASFTHRFQGRLNSQTGSAEAAQKCHASCILLCCKTLLVQSVRAQHLLLPMFHHEGQDQAKPSVAGQATCQLRSTPLWDSTKERLVPQPFMHGHSGTSRHGHSAALTLMATPCSTMWSNRSGSKGSPTFSQRSPPGAVSFTCTFSDRLSKVYWACSSAERG